MSSNSLDIRKVFAGVILVAKTIFLAYVGVFLSIFLYFVNYTNWGRSIFGVIGIFRMIIINSFFTLIDYPMYIISGLIAASLAIMQSPFLSLEKRTGFPVPQIGLIIGSLIAIIIIVIQNRY